MDVLELVPFWLWFVTVFCFGACIGSFLNVVIYRMPREQSLISPPSACPSCGKRIAFFDNVPIFSWLILLAKCRHCKAKISARYFFVELTTALLYLFLFVWYFRTEYRMGVGPIEQGGWLVYIVHIVLISCLLAASGIDLDYYIIPLSVCWFATLVGVLGSSVSGFIMDPKLVRGYHLLPMASPKIAAISAGGIVGWIFSLILLKVGVIKRSYESEQYEGTGERLETPEPIPDPDDKINHRLEMLKEVVFLLPIFLVAFAGYWLLYRNELCECWVCFSQTPVISGFLGSVFGYFVGCGVVWATRILGTLGFGREAMGLGDVHLMGAAGCIVGPVMIVIAFLVAPFFGIVWAVFQMFFKKIREIPYGPFLSLAVFIVMIFHDWIRTYIIDFYLLHQY